MPYQTVDLQNMAPEKSGAIFIGGRNTPDCQITLWPHQSLPRTGFVAYMGVTAALLALPLLTMIGSPVLWGLLPFVLLALTGIWMALQRSYSDGSVTETLSIWSDRVTLVRHGPRGKRADWAANPYWVTAALHATGGPVPNYLTLRGADREVELGAFLTEAERLALHDEVTGLLARTR